MHTMQQAHTYRDIKL